MTERALAVIPARLASTRLPRKPLLVLAGRPLVEWVWRRVRDLDLFARVVIATDSAEVADCARAFGADVELTRADHPAGTDRVAEVVRRPAYSEYPLVVNVQGDEPFVSRDQLQAALRQIRAPGCDVATLATPLAAVDEWRDPAVVKVVRDGRGRALLFSRAPIPFRRDGVPGPAELAAGLYLRHIGVYAYRREALLRWVALPETELERTERLEQLRPLAAGFAIAVAVVPPGEPGIDTPADAERAERVLAAGALPSPLQFVPVKQ